jgi:hypothetical protein
MDFIRVVMNYSFGMSKTICSCMHVFFVLLIKEVIHFQLEMYFVPLKFSLFFKFMTNM